ncbi:MAG: hemolysin family protein [Rickettsiales bacterium]|nr:hemolysin family protein [Rickettsiales bacterium]
MNNAAKKTSDIASTALSGDSRVEPESSSEKQSLLQAIRRWLRHALTNRPDASLKEMLEEAIEEHEEQGQVPLEPEEKIMLHNVLTFGDIKVSDIMVPRPDIAAVSADISLEQLKAHIYEQRHTRTPVYQDSLDRILGFLHVKDLLPMLSGDRPYDLKAAVRSILVVPPSMRVLDLLVKMRHSGSHIAMVVDEYGGTDGLVTMEDVFEEIVGDIQDEHDEDEDQTDRIHRLRDGIFEVSARMRIEKLEKELGLNLVTEEKDNEFDTLGGLIFFKLGRVPARGEVVPHTHGVQFEITDADSRRIRRVKIITT